MATLANLEWYRGEDVTLNFTMAPVVDITGWTISFRAKSDATQTALVTVNATITVAASGTFAVALTAAQTTSLNASTYAYDVWRTDSGAATALTMGTITSKGSPRIP